MTQKKKGTAKMPVNAIKDNVAREGELVKWEPKGESISEPNLLTDVPDDLITPSHALTAEESGRLDELYKQRMAATDAALRVALDEEIGTLKRTVRDRWRAQYASADYEWAMVQCVKNASVELVVAYRMRTLDIIRRTIPDADIDWPIDGDSVNMVDVCQAGTRREKYAADALTQLTPNTEEYVGVWELAAEDELRVPLMMACGQWMSALRIIHDRRDEHDSINGPSGYIIASEIIEDAIMHRWTFGWAYETRKRVSAVQETGAQAARQLIDSLTITSHTWPIHKTMDAIAQRSVINEPPLPVLVAHATPNAPAITSVLSVTCDIDPAGLFIDGHLAVYQCAVSDAVMALYTEMQSQERPIQITRRMIFDAMPGVHHSKPVKAQLDKIHDAMIALRHLDITYDCARELARRGITNVPLNAPYFSFAVMPGVDRYGNEFEYYEFDREPLLLTVARVTNQRIAFPSRCLAVPLSATDSNYAIIRCLVRRIARMNYANERCQLEEQFTRISIGGICKHTGLEYGSTGTSKGRFRRKCEMAFEHWKSIGWIDDYKPYKTGNEIAGWEITPRGGLKLLETSGKKAKK